MIKNSKGSASVESVIFMTLIICFIILPLASFSLEKLIITTCVKQVVETMEIALYDMVEAVDLERLSEGRVDFDTGQLSGLFSEAIDKEMSTLVSIELQALEFYPFTGHYLKCSPQKKMHYDVLHVELTMDYNLSLYRNILDLESKLIKFHFDLEIPKNN